MFGNSVGFPLFLTKSSFFFSLSFSRSLSSSSDLASSTKIRARYYWGGLISIASKWPHFSLFLLLPYPSLSPDPPFHHFRASKSVFWRFQVHTIANRRILRHLNCKRSPPGFKHCWITFRSLCLSHHVCEKPLFILFLTLFLLLH